MADSDHTPRNTGRPLDAAERINRLSALLHAIYCCANGDTKPGDPGNADTITCLAGIAEDELAALEGGAQ